jgi:lambda repressor-like predicted transcriptional regulator
MRTRINEIPSGMTPDEINNALKAVGLNQSAIARSLNKSKTAVSLVVKDKAVSLAIAEAISEAIKKDKKYIWPNHYWNGNPKRGPKKVVWQRNAAAA